MTPLIPSYNEIMIKAEDFAYREHRACKCIELSGRADNGESRVPRISI